ncbi:hypothetical protein EBR66_05980 [bacterium]|jgi:hypothetical protein|nr:hypothetical protein [bacterium]
MASYNGQSAQDLFALKCLKYKRGGTFLEIGSNDPIYINNTYLLEKDYGWKGYMVEYQPHFLQLYKTVRPNSKYIIDDATEIDYAEVCEDLGADIDYLQIDLEVSNESTLKTLRKLHADAMCKHRFAVVTFEHDIYVGDHFNTREESRRIFESAGYVRVFSDVKNTGMPYEDWYVHPELVDMEYINKIKNNVSMEYTEIVSILESV